MTAQLLLANPDVYTLWNYRREIICRRKVPADQSSGTDDDCSGPHLTQFDAMCKDELALSTSCLLKNPKSYPCWHHRCWSMQMMYQPDYESEIQLCNSALQRDSRNFHCWNYRRFLFRAANINIEREIEFTEAKIRENFSNFSSWYLRSTLLTEAAESKLLDIRQLWDKEYESVENAIYTDPTDQSAWFYHKWLSSIDLGASVSNPTLIFDAGIAVKQIVWNKLRNFIVVHFSRALESCPVIRIRLPDGVVNDNTDFVPLSTTQLEPAFVLKDLKTAATVTIEFQDVNFDVSASEDIVMRNAISSCHQRKRVLKDGNVANLIELQELEPENKWTNLALTFFGCDRVSTLQKLCQIDPCRTNFYRDQASDVCLDQILTQSATCCSMEIKCQQLTKISSLDRMVHMRFLDLSGNQLVTLPRSFNQLYSLETLIVSDNKILTVSRGLALLSLRKLSLIRNRIASLQVLDRLKCCLNLDVVYLHGNPCSDAVRDGAISTDLWNWDQASPNLQPFEGSVSIGSLEATPKA